MSIDREFEGLVCRIAEQALDVPAAELSRFLDRACKGRADLRREVETFLECLDSGDDSPLSPALQDLISRVQPGNAPGGGSLADDRITTVSYEDLVDHLATPSGGSSTRYRLRGEVGRGGMAAVLRVWDENLHRPLAMKVILGTGDAQETGDTPPADTRLQRRFLKEAHVTGRLDHPGIVPVHELGLDDQGRVYFTMKLVKGRTLDRIFELVERGEEGWTRTRAVGLILRVCEAVAFAHDKGVIHRDLKPRNVMVGGFGEVYVMDWGLARILGDDGIEEEVASTSPEFSGASSPGEDELQLTREGDVLGTPTYMPLEQAMGARTEIGPHSDVYSVGAILYHLLTGHPPYVRPGERPSSEVVLARVIAGPPRSLEEQVSDTPAELSAICEKAMRRDWTKRYSTMQGLASDLGAYLEGRVVTAYETGAWPEAKKWVKRNRALAGSLAAVFVLLVAGMTTAWILNQEANAAIADRHREESARLQKTEEVLRLSASQDYDDLIEQAKGLWPADPGHIEAYEDWITAAEQLAARLPELRDTREKLQRDALPRTEEQRRRQRESHPDYGKLEPLSKKIEAKRQALAVRRGGARPERPPVRWIEYHEGATGLNEQAWGMVGPHRVTFGREALGRELAEKAVKIAPVAQKAGCLDTVAWGNLALGLDEDAVKAGDQALKAASEHDRELLAGSLARIAAAAAFASSEAGLVEAEAEIAQLEDERATLSLRVAERREWSFPEEKSSSRWWNNQLTKLIGELESLKAPGTGLLTEDGVSEERGWSIPRRLAFAKGLRNGLEPGGQYASRWEEALPAIHATYPELDLAVQMGLVPIGADPDSGLWEFWHVQSGTEPRRGEDGKLVMEESSGLVFVLLPGGKFWMGAQRKDPAKQNHDPNAEYDEYPAHEVELSAFFLSKYEMTQGQWEHSAGRNPSNYQHRLRTPTLVHPVEQVSWLDCMALLPTLGLTLPSEAQWEYGARGGTDTVWWTGSDRETLRTVGAANLADQAAARIGAPYEGIKDWPELDDGYPFHAPVGSYAANRFGLHEVHGNLHEWCLDAYAPRFYGRLLAKDPVNSPEGARTCVNRGGSFDEPAGASRSADRESDTKADDDNYLGLRPARAID